MGTSPKRGQLFVNSAHGSPTPTPERLQEDSRCNDDWSAFLQVAALNNVQAEVAQICRDSTGNSCSRQSHFVSFHQIKTVLMFLFLTLESTCESTQPSIFVFYEPCLSICHVCVYTSWCIWIYRVISLYSSLRHLDSSGILTANLSAHGHFQKHFIFKSLHSSCFHFVVWKFCIFTRKCCHVNAPELLCSFSKLNWKQQARCVLKNSSIVSYFCLVSWKFTFQRAPTPLRRTVSVLYSFFPS